MLENILHDFGRGISSAANAGGLLFRSAIPITRHVRTHLTGHAHDAVFPSVKKRSWHRLRRRTGALLRVSAKQTPPVGEWGRDEAAAGWGGDGPGLVRCLNDSIPGLVPIEANKSEPIPAVTSRSVGKPTNERRSAATTRSGKPVRALRC